MCTQKKIIIFLCIFMPYKSVFKFVWNYYLAIYVGMWKEHVWIRHPCYSPVLVCIYINIQYHQLYYRVRVDMTCVKYDYVYYWWLNATSRYTEAHKRHARNISVKWTTYGEKNEQQKKKNPNQNIPHSGLLKNHRLTTTTLQYHCVEDRILDFFPYNIFFARANNRYTRYIHSHSVWQCHLVADDRNEEGIHWEQLEHIL